MLNATMPPAMCTCTSMGRVSTPSNANVATRVTMPASVSAGTFAEH
jgi:hypothetical protein